MSECINEEISDTEKKESGDNLDSDKAEAENLAEAHQEKNSSNEQPEVLDKEVIDYKSRFFYLAAEMDNLQKRQQREKESFIKYGNEKIVTDLIDVLDNLERTLVALASETDDKIRNIIKGIEMVRSQFYDVLKKYGVTQIEAIGKEFDPNFHDAVSKKVVEDKEDNLVIEEFQKGYLLNGRLIRAAMVAVNSK